MRVVSGTVRECRGCYRLVVRYRDSEGDLRQATKQASTTDKISAWRELAEWRDLLEGGTPRIVTVPEYVSAYVDRLEAAHAVEASTLAGYRHTIKHVQDLFSAVPLEALSADAVEAAQGKMISRGYSYSTVSKVRKLVNAAYRAAVRAGDAQRNPVEASRAPHKGNKRPGINYLPEAGRKRLLEALSALSAEPIARAGLLALCCGLRAGEACGLMQMDVCSQARMLNVRRAVGRTDTEAYVKATKAGRARSVPIVPELAKAMEAWPRVQARAYVVNCSAAPPNPNTISRQWRKLARDLGLIGSEGRPLTYHDLRHTYATAAIAGGLDVKTLSAIMGHASAAMTLDVYTSVDLEARSRACAVMSRALFG